MGNKTLRTAQKAKRDEFYTQSSDIENELKHYRTHFKGKKVFCNCDDPKESNFFQFFAKNFEFLGLEKLVTTHFRDDEPTYKLVVDRQLDVNNDGKIDADDAIKTKLTQCGDFRSSECIELLKECDIVVTNPPFSLFQDYVAQLMKYNKKFLIIGNMNAVINKAMFPLITGNKIWYGVGSNLTMKFRIPDSYEGIIEGDGFKYGKVSAIAWFTNMIHKKRGEEILLYKSYSPEDYPKYDNYNAINIDKVKDIPIDYMGEMGVPVTFLGKYNPSQFEVLDISPHFLRDENMQGNLIVNGKDKFTRVLIKRK